MFSSWPKKNAKFKFGSNELVSEWGLSSIKYGDKNNMQLAIKKKFKVKTLFLKSLKQ